MIKNLVKSFIPHSVKESIREKRERKRRNELFGELAHLVPPVKSMFDGVASLEAFKAQGDEFLAIYRDVCGLSPDETMLDVGCGIGRKTLPLIGYLNAQGRYEGIDITKAGIDWCRERIPPQDSRFHFQQIDVYNRLYNPTGSNLPSEYRFPFPDESFGFVALGSVFTHMLPPDLTNYLAQVQRVLKKGGRCLITYFLLNDESLRFIETGRSTIDLKFVYEQYRTASEESPEDAVAFDEQWIRNLYRDTGLQIQRLDYGSWCGRERYLSYQDLIFATK